jgi:REP element-mobilizing transposase RayT
MTEMARSMPTLSSPVIYLITFACYGHHLHGDESGSVDRLHNQPRTPAIARDLGRAALERRLMDQPAYSMDGPRRDAVLTSLIDRSKQRGWILIAAHVRSNHVHVIVETDAMAERVMNDLKSFASRFLNQAGFDTPERKRWARHGSTRLLREPANIGAAIRYVIEKQVILWRPLLRWSTADRSLWSRLKALA